MSIAKVWQGSRDDLHEAGADINSFMSRQCTLPYCRNVFALR